ncbi:MAG: hypothetical protein ABW067_06000 [Rhizobacter sp.]|jgi:hypothetical protein
MTWTAKALLPFLVLCTPAHAMTRCPPEFGPKDPLVNLFGWLVFAVAIVLGGLLFGFVVRRSRGMHGLLRGAVITLGLVGTGIVWIGGFALAFVFFFFRC